MSDIFTILSEAGVEVGEELKKPLLKAVGENYRTIAEYEKKTSRIAELEKQNYGLESIPFTANFSGITGLQERRFNIY